MRGSYNLRDPFGIGTVQDRKENHQCIHADESPPATRFVGTGRMHSKHQEMVFRTHVYERETIRGTAGNVDFFRHESLTIDDCLMMLVAHYQTKTAVISDG